MAIVKIDTSKTIGIIKPMHCTVNGPVANHDGSGGTVEGFKEIGVPYVRVHDSSFFSNYGGEHTVDITGIFPDFEKDPYDPASYDFFYTDWYLKRIRDVGSKIFYRLGQRIEVQPKKYHVHPPKDFKKWAVICEHIIRHFNEGWNDGFHYGIEYWEIWNEPDNRPACWTGTDEQFQDLFEITAKHLKACFPELKIGGPAFAEWSVDNGTVKKFLQEMKAREVPMDFLSWHTYSRRIEEFTTRALNVRQTLDSCGYANTESIVDEWNYLVNWRAGMAESKRKIVSMEGAAFVAANQATVQNVPIDMLMYYDARPCAFNGLFRAFTYEKYKAFYSMLFFSKVYQAGTQVESVSDDADVYAVAAANEKDCAAVVTYYTYDPAAREKTVTVTIDAPEAELDVYLLDDTHDAEIVRKVRTKELLELKLLPNSVVLLTGSFSGEE